MFRVLAINPGSTSTKIGVYDDREKVFEKVLRHSTEELDKFNSVMDQYEYRKEEITKALNENNISMDTLSAIACRGGAIECKLIGGTYLVTDKVCQVHRESKLQHPSTLAVIIGKNIADELGINAYFTDSPSTYEMSKVASVSGHKDIERAGKFHALNQKAVARQYAKDTGRKYEELNLVVCHMGGGCSVGAHKEGMVVDVTDALSEGPFSPERTGALPVHAVVDMCFSGKYTYAEMKKQIQGQGGLNSYLGMNDVKLIGEQAEHNAEAKFILEAMAYQVSKEIGAMATVLKGNIDAIILTGGIAYSKLITEYIKESVSYLAPIHIYAGEQELEALVEGTLRILNDEEQVKQF